MATGRIELGPTGKTVAANVKRLRDDKGWSLRALAKRMEEAGRRLSADALNKIENGRLVDDPDHQDKPLYVRRVDADDLMALAVALDVNPSALLLPPTIEGKAEITGKSAVSTHTLWRWAQGERPLVTPDNDDGTALVEFQRRSRPHGIRMWPVRTPAGREAVRDTPEDQGAVHHMPDGTVTIGPRGEATDG